MIVVEAGGAEHADAGADKMEGPKSTDKLSSNPQDAPKIMRAGLGAFEENLLITVVLSRGRQLNQETR